VDEKGASIIDIRRSCDKRMFLPNRREMKIQQLTGRTKETAITVRQSRRFLMITWGQQG
jgi:hypothetical protein